MGDRENTGRRNRESDHNAQQPLPPASAPPAPNPEQPHGSNIHSGPNRNPEESERWLRNPDWWMVIVTGLAFVVAGITLIVFYGQFREMQTQSRILNAQAKQAAQDSVDASKRVEQQLGIADRQAKAAENSVAAIQRQTRTAQRALINIPVPPIGASAVKEGEPIIVKVQFVNTGNTSARKIQMDVAIDKVKNGDDPTFDYTWDHAHGTTGLLLKGESVELEGHRYVRQHTTTSPNATDLPLSHDEEQEFANNRIFFVVYARVRYLDIFGVQHWTKRCESMVPQPPPGSNWSVSARKCTDYGDTDNN